MPKRWDTLRLAKYGALVGFVIEACIALPSPGWGAGALGYKVGSMMGGAAGAALLVGIVSGLRNFCVRPIRYNSN
jgi:hypothetical protein